MGETYLLCPQPFVGRAHLTRDVTGHLRWQTKLQADITVAILLQGTSTTRFAVLKGRLTHRIQGITIGQLGLAQCLELLGRRLQFELGGEHLFHQTSLPDVHALCQEVQLCEEYRPTPITPATRNAHCSPAINGRGTPQRFVEILPLMEYSKCGNTH